MHEVGLKHVGCVCVVRMQSAPPLGAWQHCLEGLRGSVGAGAVWSLRAGTGLVGGGCCAGVRGTCCAAHIKCFK